MAKLRVYELAKELDIPNKDLVEWISDLGIQIKGHMSSLGEEEAKLVRDTVMGRSQQLIVEKRVRRGVIRRRRKVVKTEPPPEAVEVEAEAVPPVDAQTEEAVLAEPAEGKPEEAPAVTDEPAPEPETEEPEKVELEAEIAKKAEPKKKVEEKE